MNRLTAFLDWIDEPPEPSPDPFPAGPGTPARHHGVRTWRSRKAPAVLRLTPEPAEHRIRAVLAADPAASINAIAKRAGVGKSTASKWRAVWLSERERDARDDAEAPATGALQRGQVAQ